MLGEVNLTHTTSAEQALNNVASEDLTVVQRHVRKPTNDKANAYKERGHQKAKDSEGMLAPITESMVPSALPDWSALSRSARRQAIKWMIGLGYNEDEARMLPNTPNTFANAVGPSVPSSGQAPTLLPPADWSVRTHSPPPQQPAAGQ